MSPVASAAITFHEHGEPLDVLHETEVHVVDPPPGRIRVRVSAVGLNPADWELCRGFMPGRLPRGIGCDVAGFVDAVGPDVVDVTPGDAVFGSADFAGQPSAGAADYAIMDGWHRTPSHLTATDAAALPLVVQTAVWTLDAMAMAPGSTLLVNGAGGMVGFAAVQIALRRGFPVFATAGTAFAADLTRFGAVVTSYGEGVAERLLELGGETIDFVLDAAPPAPDSIRELIATVATPDRVMTIANHADARRLGARVNLDCIADPAPPATFLPEYAQLAAHDSFRVPIARSFPLGQWRAAVELSTSGRPRGKVVLLPGR